MAAESILTYLKPNFPETETGAQGTRTRLEYIGPDETISAEKPAEGATWGDYSGTVESATDNPVSGSTPLQRELTVVMVAEYESPDDATGEEAGTSREIEWVPVQRSMFEHPQFIPGGGGANQLSLTDIANIEAWKNNKKFPTRKAAYQYPDRYSNDPGEQVYWADLSANARLFAKGILLGVETWEDYAPVARKTTVFVNGPPIESKAGEKDRPTGFSVLPDGEYRKSADRGLQADAKNKWSRIEEWTGAVKVLVDKKKVYWDP